MHRWAMTVPIPLTCVFAIELIASLFNTPGNRPFARRAIERLAEEVGMAASRIRTISLAKWASMSLQEARGAIPGAAVDRQYV
jgi:hypothetical protein